MTLLDIIKQNLDYVYSPRGLRTNRLRRIFKAYGKVLGWELIDRQDRHNPQGLIVWTEGSRRQS
jgi:hypothetical protein